MTSETVNNAEDFHEELHDTFYDKKVLIEGDSWVSHPQVSNLAKQFEQDRDHEAIILNLGAPGDDALSTKHSNSVFIGKQFRELKKILTNEQHGFVFDLIFLSIAGNDIIGPDILEHKYVKQKTTGGGYGGELLTGEFDDAVKRIASGYKKFIDMVRADTMNKETPIVTHTYSFLQPRLSGTNIFGIEFGDGWIATHLDHQSIGVDDPDEQYDILKAMFTRYQEAMEPLNGKKGFHVIDTTETLLKDDGTPDTSVFHDEIHPKGRGFRKVYAEIKSQLKSKNVFYS